LTQLSFGFGRLSHVYFEDCLGAGSGALHAAYFQRPPPSRLRRPERAAAALSVRLPFMAAGFCIARDRQRETIINKFAD
jgi:hypothetical protein